MKPSLLLSLVTLPLLVTACATQSPPQVFHNPDPSALVVESLDSRMARQILPTPTGQMENQQLLKQAQNLPQRQTAVVILENYSESEVGPVFHERSFLWFAELRGLGCQHIYFLQGNGLATPDGLIALAEYH
jgi:hypothetical protein